MPPLQQQAGDTIVALSTPHGYSGIGVIRVSGPDARSILGRIFQPSHGGMGFPSRRALYGTVRDPETGKILDDGMALFLEGPSTYTGEDMVELSLHGSPVVLDSVIRAIFRSGARPAQRGEFTKRAFLSGKLDLVQAEAVIDLIEAGSPVAAEEARARLDKSLSDQIHQISDALKDLVAVMEAHIDFDEDEEEPPPNPAPDLREILRRIKDLRKTAETGRMRREGLATVIVGKPNVGKSSILNAILEEPRAIVTQEAGTTRDVIVESVDLHGIALRLSDTAGIREPGCEVERLGVERSERAIEEADLAIFIVDSSEPLSSEDLRIIERLTGKAHVVVAANKTDLKPDAELSGLAGRLPGRKIVRTSATRGTGIKELEEAVFSEIANGAAIAPEEVLVSGLRHRQALERARAALAAACDAIEKKMSLEFVAVDLREALDDLGEIIGTVVTDDLLDRIFSEFCIGK